MTYATEVLADSPLLYWQLDETFGSAAADSSGNSRPGTYSTSGTTKGVTGGRADGNKAVALDGVDGLVSSSYAALVVGAQRTVEMVYKRTNHSAAHTLWGCNSAHTYLQLLNGGQDIMWVPESDDATETWSGAGPGDGAFVHCVLRINDTAHQAELLINAVSKGLRTGLAAIHTSPGTFIVGSRFDGFAYQPFLGVADEVAVYSGLLSNARVTAHNAALASTGATAGRLSFPISGTYHKGPLKGNFGGTWKEIPVKSHVGGSWAALL